MQICIVIWTDDDSTRLAGHTSYQYDRIISIAIVLATLVGGESGNEPSQWMCLS